MSRQKLVIVDIHERRLHGEPRIHCFAFRGNEKIEVIMWKLWAASFSRISNYLRYEPKKISIWQNLKPDGDSHSVGTYLASSDSLRSANVKMLGRTTPRRFGMFQTNSSSNLKHFNGSMSLQICNTYIPTHRRRELSRLETVKQLFHGLFLDDTTLLFRLWGV